MWFYWIMKLGELQKGDKIISVIRIHPMGSMNVCANLYYTIQNSQNISVWKKMVNQHTINRHCHRVVQLAWLTKPARVLIVTSCIVAFTSELTRNMVSITFARVSFRFLQISKIKNYVFKKCCSFTFKESMTSNEVVLEAHNGPKPHLMN